MICRGLAGIAAALAAAPALAGADYAVIEMQTAVDAPAQTVWAAVGPYCAIADWANIECVITAGEGGVGTVRSLFGGRVEEVLIGRTELSYGYATPPPADGGFHDLYHGFLEARPIGDTQTLLVYTLMYDASNLADDAARTADIQRRRTAFEGFLGNMKTMVEGD